MPVRPIHKKNANASIFSNALGSSTVVNFQQFWKARSPISLIDSGIVIDFKYDSWPLSTANA